MARKLSANTWRRAFLLLLAALFGAAPAQVAGEPAAAPMVVENPFANGSAAAPLGASPMPPSRRQAITYQNPFAGAAGAPPLETPLPGPASRWQAPASPLNEPTTVKIAILSTDSSYARRAEWNELVTVESILASHSTRPADNDLSQSALGHVRQAGGISFEPQPLVQPVWFAAVPPAQSVVEGSLAAAPPALPLRSPAPPTKSRHLQLEWPNLGESFDLSLGGGASAISQAAPMPLLISDYADSPEAWLASAQQAAHSAKSLEDLAAAAGMCQKGLAASPAEEVASSLRRLAAWVHNRRGELLVEAGQPSEAIDEFRAAISLDPHCSPAIHNRAVTLAEQQQFDAALRDFNRVIQINPDLAVAYRNRGELLAALDRCDEAVADYSRALQSLSDDAELYAARSHARQRLGDLDAALVDLNHAIELKPREPLMLTQRGNLLAERGEFDGALADFRRALALDADCAEAHRSLAWLLATCADGRVRDPNQALAAADRAAKLAPGDYLVLDTLAAAHASAGQFERAVDLQHQAIAAAPATHAGPLRERLQLYQQNRLPGAAR